MEERKLVVGGFYKHFKDKLYQVKCVAYHSETKEKMVVYQALYGDYSVYVRPYDMFLSPVDKEKYPEVTQQYRFEQVELDGSEMPQNKQAKAEKTEKTEKTAVAEIKAEAEPQVATENASDSTEGLDEGLEMFLDAETYQEKLNVLAGIKHRMDNKMVDTFAAVLDIEVPEGPLEERIESIRNCLKTQAKFEVTRLR